ncbi:MAG: putative zinc-binding metallopeptidase [Pseudomonadota bacterium]
MGRRARKRQPYWADWSDDELLDLRFCDLDLSIEGTMLEACIDKLYDELDARNIRHKPHCWLSSEWFSPDGVPGIALPFYLTHPRLMRLEKRKMLEVEGGTRRWCMRLLRHEAGHALSTAYRLHFKKRWRDAFGKMSTPYPQSYAPKANSRDYVLHLDYWYAQAHPAEDFAETFAVWLKPRSRWRQTYEGWPALKKLQTVDSIFRDIAGESAPVRSRRHVDPLKALKSTLKRHYRRKQRHYANTWPDFYDRDLRKLFSDDANCRGHESAARFLRRARPEIRELVGRWTGQHPYTIDHVVRDMIERSKELKLRLAVPEDEARKHVAIMVAVQTMNYIHDGHHRIAL